MDVEQRVKNNLLLILESDGKNVSEINLSDSLKEDLDLTSIMNMAFISSIEKDFNLEIGFYQLEHIKTVKDVVDFIKDKKNAK